MLCKTTHVIRSIHRRCSVKKGVLKSFANFTGKHLCCSLHVYKVIKKRLQHRCFLVKFAKFLREAILKYICEWLLLNNELIKCQLFEWTTCIFLQIVSHCVKRVGIWSFSGPYFPAFVPNSERELRDTEYLSVFSPNATKYELEKLQIRTLFTQC